MTERAATGAIYDRGYRHYDGPREGGGRRVRAIALTGLKRALGIKRSWKTKVWPFGLIALAFAPAIIFIGVRVIVGEQLDEFLDYADYFGLIAVVLLLFASTAGAELLCPDRRQGVLALVFTRPVTWLDYLAGKLIAMLTLVGLLALTPALLLFTASAFTAPNALTYGREHLGDLGAILVAAAGLAVFYAVTALAVAATTGRRTIATAVYLGAFLASSTIVNLVLENTDLPGRRWLALASLVEVPTSFVGWAFGVSDGSSGPPGAFGFGAYAIALLVISALALVLLAGRVRRLAA